MWNPDLYHTAWHFAAGAHLGQKVPGTELPYVVHLSNVCMEVLNAHAHEDIHKINLAMQCALLHDTLEDTGITFQGLALRFGSEVAAGVLALTKDERLPPSARMPDSLRRIKRLGPEIRIVKMADRITNLETPPAHWRTDKIRRYHQEAIRILEQLSGCHSYIENRLEGKIEAYAKYF